MKSIQSELERLKRRQVLKNKGIEATLDQLSKDLNELITGLEKQHKEVHSVPSEVSMVQLGFNTQLRQTCESIINKKNLRTIQNVHKEHFVYVSKLGKTIEKELSDSSNQQLLDGVLGKRDLMEFLDYSNSIEPYNKIKEANPSSLAAKLLKIKGLLEAKNYAKAFEESTKNMLDDPILKEMLSFELLKLGYLNLIAQGKRSEGIAFLKKFHTLKNLDFSVHYGEMISLATYKDLSSLPKRLTNYCQETILEKCLQMISKRIRKSLGLPEVSPLQEIVSAGLLAYPELSKDPVVFCSDRKDSDLTAQIHLPSHMVHHSIIYCPITREFCHEETNRALYQSCGHVVGEQSVRKMMESNKKNKETDSFKCPTCPNQQRLSTMKEVNY